MQTESLTIRLARPTDAQALSRLAALDSAAVPAGPLVVAEHHGELRAALPVAGGKPIADPFRPTAEAVDLLRLRASGLRGGDERRSRRVRRRLSTRLRTGTGVAPAPLARPPV